MYTFKTLPKLNFEELRTFVAVVEMKSFSRAADELCRTTAAVSYRVKMLENSLGAPLIMRQSKGFDLTPAGQWLYTKASELLNWQQNIPEEINAIKNGVESHFTLVINNLLYDHLCVARLISVLKQRYPFTKLKVIRSVYNGVWDSLMYDSGSLAIGAPTFHSIDDNFVTEPLGLIQWKLVTSPDHPVAKMSKVTRDDLRNYPVVNIEDSSSHMQKRLPWRLVGQEEILVPNLRTKVACHERGLGVGFLPSSLVSEQLQKGSLVIVENFDEHLRTSSPMSLAWAKEDSGIVNRWLRDLVKKRDDLVAPLLAPISPTQ